MKHAPVSKVSPLVFMALLSLALSARADLLAECNQTAGAINKSTPQTLDRVTTLLSAVCFKEGATVTLQYRNKLDVPAGTVDQAKINTLKPSMVNAWCTDPTQRQVLNQVNIQYTYSDAKGKYIGKVDIAKRECR